jgi:PEP-CTERM motif
MATRKRDVHKLVGAAIFLFLGLTPALALPVAVPAQSLPTVISNAKPAAAGFTGVDLFPATEPAALALLGSGLLGVAFLIRRMQS